MVEGLQYGSFYEMDHSQNEAATFRGSATEENTIAPSSRELSYRRLHCQESFNAIL